jgi:hypothetical protein
VGCGLWDDTGHQTSSEFIEQLLTSLHLRDIEICVCLHRTRCGDDAGPTVGFGGYQRYIIPYKTLEDEKCKIGEAGFRRKTSKRALKMLSRSRDVESAEAHGGRVSRYTSSAGVAKVEPLTAR